MPEDSLAPDPQAAPAPENKPLPIKQKLAFGLGTATDVWGNWLYAGMVWPVFNIFLLVDPKLIGTVLLVNRLFDALSDPFFGWWSDKTRSRYGRRRPFILIGSILTGLTFPLLFLVDRSWDQDTIFWFMIISSCFFITVVSSYNVPYQSLANEMTPDYNERTSVFQWKAGIQKIMEVANFAAPMFITCALFQDIDGKPNSLRGAQVYTVMLGMLMMIFGIVIFKTIKERYYQKVIQSHQKVKPWECFLTLKNKPFRAHLLMAIAYLMGTQLVGVLGYYTTIYYVCQGDQVKGNQWNFYMGIGGMLFALAGVSLFGMIAKRLGKLKTMVLVQVASALAFAATWFLYTPSFPAIQVFASGMIAFTGAGFWLMHGAIGADVIDDDELNTGKRREGSFAAGSTWIMKVGMAIGIGASGWVLPLTGFDAALGANQSPEAIHTIRVLLATVPIIGLFLSYFALIFIRLTPKRMIETRRILEERRGTV